MSQAKPPEEFVTFAKNFVSWRIILIFLVLLLPPARNELDRLVKQSNEAKKSRLLSQPEYKEWVCSWQTPPEMEPFLSGEAAQGVNLPSIIRRFDSEYFVFDVQFGNGRIINFSWNRSQSDGQWSQDDPPASGRWQLRATSPKSFQGFVINEAGVKRFMTLKAK